MRVGPSSGARVSSYAPSCMRRRFWDRAATFLEGIVLVAAGASAACGGGRTADLADASNPGKDGSPEAGPPVDAGTPGEDCGPPDGAFAAYVSPAAGTIAGSGVMASICNAEAYVFLSRYTTPPGDYLLFINSAQASTFTFNGPPGANDGLLDATMLISGPMPGTYASAGSSSCGFLGFSYDLPIPPGVDCDGGTGPDCPPGCTAACSGQGCEPCMPSAPEVSYGASAASDCLGETQTPAGSWTATITSIKPASTEQNGTYYLAHGTFSATLVNEGDAGSAMVNVSMAF
jgi:hypothetical protein